ncbi:MAG: cytochrome c oxidase subunit 3 family protein [Desulfobacteraceae bacterium]|nr:MAG: cytochrome c oxidase subunit 3 family protein [Desulfobacteraceae bacterium]
MNSSTPDKAGVKLGMWLFLYTEIMLFGGLFVLYAAYYSKYTSVFIEAGKSLDITIGALNTMILLVSSFTVASAITAIQKKARRSAAALVGVSMVFGVLFLVNKYFEWGHKFEAGIYPGSPDLSDAEAGKSLFFGLYYLITGLHGIHIIIGLILLSISLYFITTKRIHETQFVVLENSGLYWHLVDLIWIFIFPLFYLIL